MLPGQENPLAHDRNQVGEHKCTLGTPSQQSAFLLRLTYGSVVSPSTSALGLFAVSIRGSASLCLSYSSLLSTMLYVQCVVRMSGFVADRYLVYHLLCVGIRHFPDGVQTPLEE